MSDPRARMNSDTPKELYEIMRRGKAIEVHKESDRMVLSSLMATISGITKMRTKRIAVANERTPSRLLTLLVSMSLLLFLAFVLPGVRGSGCTS